MKPINNFNSVSAAGKYAELTAGGYVCKITKVDDVPSKEYLNIEFDIVEGALKGYSSDMLERLGWTSCHFPKSYKSSALAFFKQFLEAVDETNKTTFAKEVESGFNEQKLVGKGIGIVFGMEEHRKNDGSIKTRINTNSMQFKTANEIRNGDFVVPEFKKLEGATENTDSPFTTLNDDGGNLPF